MCEHRGDSLQDGNACLLDLLACHGWDVTAHLVRDQLVDLNVDGVHGDGLPMADACEVIMRADLRDIVAGSVNEAADALQRRRDAHAAQTQQQLRSDSGGINFERLLLDHNGTLSC